MAALKFRVYMEEDEVIYRDIVINHKQTFFDLHLAILKSYDFDNKHQATFYRSNDNRDKGREILVEAYDKEYKAPPLIMSETTIASEVFDTNQKFIYVYDFAKNWVFLIELININKEENKKLVYPYCSRVEGLAPMQYGTKSLLGERFIDLEEKYDLAESKEGFGEEGEEAEGDAEDGEGFDDGESAADSEFE